MPSMALIMDILVDMPLLQMAHLLIIASAMAQAIIIVMEALSLAPILVAVPLTPMVVL